MDAERHVCKVVLVGTIGRDPDTHRDKAGELVANVSLATSRPGTENRTDWHRLVANGRMAQFMEEYVHTGCRVYVEGRLEYDCYERDGVTIPTAEIVVGELVILDCPDRRFRVHYDDGNTSDPLTKEGAEEEVVQAIENDYINRRLGDVRDLAGNPVPVTFTVRIEDEA